MDVREYLLELEDENWHTLYTLVELQQGKLEGDKQTQALNAMECAIAYLHWSKGFYGDSSLQEAIEDRLKMSV